MGLGARDDQELIAGLTRWLAATGRGTAVTGLVRPSAGYSNEIVIVDVDTADGPDSFVVRMPPAVPSFPDADPDSQAEVLRALEAAGVPAPRLVAVEHDPSFLGAPFISVTRASGSPAPEAPAVDPAMLSLAESDQRRIQDQFVESLALLHRATPPDIGLRTGLAEELAYWRHYIGWAADGSPSAGLAEALAWCEQTVPSEPPPSLLWGDARLGNAMYDDSHRLTCLLDWDLASVGPAEMDVAWYLAMEHLVARALRSTVPGFRSSEEVAARHGEAIGRPLEHLAWHEVFALVRSVAVSDKQARIAEAAGIPYPASYGDSNPMLRFLRRRIERFGASEG